MTINWVSGSGAVLDSAASPSEARDEVRVALDRIGIIAFDIDQVLTGARVSRAWTCPAHGFVQPAHKQAPAGCEATPVVVVALPEQIILMGRDHGE